MIMKTNVEKNTMMETYEAPVVEILNVAVEKGFAISATTYELDGSGDVVEKDWWFD